MENKSKQQPATHQPLQQTHQLAPHHQYHTRLHSPQPNGIVHQLLMQPPINYQPNSPIQDARSPLLENQQDLYGTRQPLEYSRHYGSRDSNYIYGQSPTQQRLEQRHLVSNPQYNHNIEHEVPKGYNAEVYNAYMRRNPPNNMEHNQIYQNHQSLYHQQSPEQQYTPSKPYLPYTNRIQSNTELLKQQYNEIQQMKLQQQMHYQNQAQMQQQHTFAQRQLMLQHIHGVQPPPNMQQSLYSDGSRSQKSLDDMIQLSSPQRDCREKTPVGANTSVSNVASPISQTSPESTSPSVKSPSSDSRRSSGGTQALRLPVAQRVLSAPVTMSGWLYKQGSDGLKVWRKRWFVLTDYCFFYYKSQDEEKLLGSVLLPSYTISACTPEDRVTRKHAFKCAHANMRTYVLAAPDQNLARRWCEVLTRASLMEEGSKRDRSTRDPNNQAEGDDDVGSDDAAPGQPTYANAPPKPRRSNDGYHSPSPDRYDPNYDLLRQPSSQYGQSTVPASPKQPQFATTPSTNKELENLYEARKSTPAQQSHYRSKQSYNAQNLSLPLTNTATDRLENTKSPASYNDSRNNVKTPNYYDNRSSEGVNVRTANTTKPDVSNQQRNEQFTKEENVRNYKENKEDRVELRQKERLDYPTNNSLGNERMAIERRTPDAYGRSAIVPGYYGKGKASDYEDIYPNYVGGDGYSVIPAYSRPLSPPSYGEKTGRSSGQGYESHQDYQMTDLDATQNYAGPPVLRRKKALAAKPQNNTVPRPHSADFLEYESRAQTHQPNIPDENTKYTIAKQPPRPKSSLDINSYYDPSSDSYYSEESYAEKMRQSSQYLQRRDLSLNAKLTNSKSQLEQLYSANLAAANYSDPRSNAEGSYGLRTSEKDVLGYDSKYSESGLSSNWTLRDKNLGEYQNRSNSAMSESSNVSGCGRDGGSKQDLLGSESFMRSASARLPSTGQDGGKEGEKKVQQREESMKRLLEWKQRMLQSPLTRKSTPAALSLARTLNQTRLPITKHQSELMSGKAGSRYRHSGPQGNVCYNSYSSDDEASISASLTGYDPSHHPTAPPISTTTAGSGSLSASKKTLVGSSGSLGRGSRECGGIPVRAVSPRVRWARGEGGEGGPRQEVAYGGSSEAPSLNIPGDTWSAVKSPLRHTPQPIRAVSPRVRRLIDDPEEKPPDPNLPLAPSTIHPDIPSQGQLDLMLDSPVTAGELLGRTHEERVLLLIQLRRRQTAAASALEVCAAQVAELQNILNSPSPSDAHPENYHRLEQLKRHLLDLERQYEKSKPLVHLVDNMVKLGSLYNRPGGSVPSTIDRLERNQELRQRLLVEQADEQRRWASSTDSLSREHIQRKVEQLAALERQLAAEAGTLHGLRADRDAIERVLGGVRTKFGDMSLTNNSSGGVDPAGSRMLQLERRSEQQALEADLTRVHMMLAHNSKKLEQTVADNARLERELMGLRHKLQGHRMSEAGLSGHGAVYDSAVSAANTTALLEDELRRVQQLVSDLQRQRQELSGAVRQLTDKSQNLAHSNNSLHCIGLSNMTNAEKQEIKTVRIVKRESERRQRDRERSVQPGTVDWSSNSNLNLDQLTEDDYNPHYNSRSTSLPRTFHGHNQMTYDDYYSTSVAGKNQPPNYLSLSNVNVPFDAMSTSMEFSPKYPSSPSLNNNNEYSRDSSSFAKAFDYSTSKSTSTHYLDSPTDSNRTLTNGPLSKTSSVVSLSKTNAELSPIFKSEAARQIIIEMSGEVKESSVHRRRVPREKRRHYTAPHHLSAKMLSEMPGRDGFGYQEKCGGRSLDDVDMERALRAPPDVVRSALAPQRFAETTIDQLLAAPRKIVIPERYVPEKPPELSPEEQKKRLEKVESIKKMLSSTPSSDPSKSPDGEEKRQREHLLQMNQILAKQVMEMSKIVAVNALHNLPLEDDSNYDSDDRSPDVELPLYQQRENYFT